MPGVCTPQTIAFLFPLGLAAGLRSTSASENFNATRMIGLGLACSFPFYLPAPGLNKDAGPGESGVTVL